MEIKGREEVFIFNHCWIEEARELLVSWIEERESRPRISSRKLEIDLEHLENCWESVMEEIQEEEDREEKEIQIKEMIYLKAEVTDLSYEVKLSKKKWQSLAKVDTEAELMDLKSGRSSRWEIEIDSSLEVNALEI